MNLGIFLLVPFSVELMPPEWALVGVGLVITPTIRAFEWVRAWFTFLCLETWWVCLLIRFAAPPKFTVVLGFVWTIALDILGTLDSARKDCMSPPPAVFALEHAQVHVSPSESNDIPANVKALIDKALSFASALIVPNVDPDNRHVWLGQYFDNPWSRCEFDIIKYLVLFQDSFDVTSIEAILSLAIWEEEDTNDLEVRFWLREARFLNL